MFWEAAGTLTFFCVVAILDHLVALILMRLVFVWTELSTIICMNFLYTVSVKSYWVTSSSTYKASNSNLNT